MPPTAHNDEQAYAGGRLPSASAAAAAAGNATGSAEGWLPSASRLRPSLSHSLSGSAGGWLPSASAASAAAGNDTGSAEGWLPSASAASAAAPLPARKTHSFNNFMLHNM